MSYDIPDVYTEEIRPSGAPVPGVGTGTVALVGKFLKGELNKLKRVGTWDQFVAEYGGLVVGSAAYDAYFVFKNLAPALVVCRVQGTQASKTIKDQQTPTPANKLTLKALVDGEFANYDAGPPKVGIEAVVDEGTITNTFSLVLNYYYAEKGEQATYTESWDNLALDPTSARYFPTIINATSALVLAIDENDEGIIAANLPDPGTYTLTGGAEPDYTGSTSPEGVDVLEKDSDINVVIADTDDSVVRSLLIDHCTAQADRICVLNTPQYMEVDDLKEIGDALDTDRAIIPGPWRVAYDPAMRVSRSFRPAPFRAGLIARLDPYLSPSNNLEYGVLDIEMTLSRADLVSLQNSKISPTYRWATRGIRVRNGLNCSSDANLSQVYRRRMADFIIESIQIACGWAVSLPITPQKKDSVLASITNWFRTLQNAGWIEGAYVKYISTPEDEAARKEIYRYGVKLWNVGDYIIFMAEIGPNTVVAGEAA